MNRARGFTLIETVIFIVIIAIAVLSVTLLFSQSVRHSNAPLERQRALALANAFMEEIRHKRWDENTPIGGGCVETGSGFCDSYCATLSAASCGVCQASAGSCQPKASASAGTGAEGEGRADFDDVDDYHGISNQSPPQDADGNPMVGYAGYAVSVTVASPAANWNGIDRRDVKRVEVVVRSPSGESIRLDAYRVNY